MSQELILLPSFPDDIGKARCRVSNAVLERIKVKAGQWVRLDSDNMSLFCRIWPANLPDNIIQADNLISQNVSSPTSMYNLPCSLVPLKTPIQASIGVTLFIKFRYTNDDNKEKKQFDDFGFVWENGPETVKHLTIKSILNDMVICKGCSIFDERRCLEIVIHETNPSNSIQLFTSDTCIQIIDGSFQNDIDEISSLLYDTTLEEKIPKSVPGLHDVYEALYEVVSYPLIYRDLIQQLNIECPKGILLYGPPGVGKTFLVNQISKACGAKMITIHGPDVFGPFFGESERRLRNAFSQAKDLTIKEDCPVILFIDELDALASRRTETQFHESRVIAQLLTLMDGMESRGRLVVIAATNRPNAIDPALRRPGRFDREIAVDVPSEQSRLEILKSQTFKMPLDDDIDLDDVLDQLASVTNGYVGADLASLCREAAMNAVHRQAALEKNEPVNLVPKITMDDFAGAMLRIVPSLRRGYHVNVGKINWDDIGGLDDVKKKLKQAVEWPIKYRHTFERLGLKPPNGILLYGPPGCSKTTLAKVIASTSGATFLSINGAQLYSPYVGDSEQIIRTTFQRARSTSPSIIFFDEIDAIVGKRSLGSSGNNDSVQERVLSMLLNEMDGIEVAASVLVVGATNRPDMLDAALLRPGRFDKLIYVPPPDLSAREQILKIYTSNMPLSDDVDLNLIAKQTELYTGADLKNLCRESAIISLRETGTALSV
ncbi:9892_t:CDS:10, partial [Dentiscutata heterogama]